MIHLRVSKIKIFSEKISNQVQIFQSILYYMVPKSRRKMYGEAKADSVPSTDSANSEKKPIIAQDYKEMLQKRLYELESESMPAT